MLRSSWRGFDHCLWLYGLCVCARVYKDVDVCTHESEIDDKCFLPSLSTLGRLRLSHLNPVLTDLPVCSGTLVPCPYLSGSLGSKL